MQEIGAQIEPVSKLKGFVDIVWVVDVTSSMKPCIDGLKSNIRFLFDEVLKQELEGGVKVDWKMRFVTYKDLNVTTDELPLLDNTRPFVATPEEVTRQLESIVIKEYQGGDLPESALDGLYTAIVKSQWRENRDPLDRCSTARRTSSEHSSQSQLAP
jgi:hypothetical protein